MDYNELCEFFGGTLFPEEYRGNLQEADDRISALEREIAQKAAHAAQQARVLLLRSVYCMLSGDFARASIHLQMILGLEPDGLERRWVLRCRVYVFHALCLQKLPPVLRFRDNFGDPLFELANLDMPIFDMLLETERVSQEIIASKPPSMVDASESVILKSSFGFTQASSLSVHAPLRASYVGSLPLDGQISGASEVADWMVKSGSPKSSYSARRFAIELEFDIGSAEAKSHLAQLYSDCESSADFVGMGICRIIEGDNALSPRLTSPVALNLVPLIQSEGWSNDDWDSVEPMHPLRDSSQAQRLYSEALFFMEAAGAPRGQAAIFLRRGCIQHAEAMASIEGNPERSSNLLMRAASNLDRAKELFLGDTTGMHLVTSHQLLLDISRGETQEVVKRSRDLGSMCHSTQNTTVLRFIAALMLRFGRRQFLDYGRSDLASVCCACARACFEGSQDPVGALQAVVAHIALLVNSGRVPMAVIKIQEARRPQGPLAAAVRYVDALRNRHKPAQILDTIRYNMIADFDSVVRKVNPAGHAEWNMQKEQLLPGNAILDRFRSVRNVLDAEAPPGLEDIHRALEDSIVTAGTRDAFLKDSQSCMAQFWSLLADADVGKAEEPLRKFVSICDSVTDLPEKLVFGRKLVALALLGATEAMKETLPRAIPESFNRESKGDLQKELQATGARSDLIKFMIHDRACEAAEAIMFCFIAQDWSRGAKVLETISNVLPDFFKEEDMAQTADGRKTTARIAAIYEHSGMPEKALEWYLYALRRLENLRQGSSDLGARRGIQSSIDSSELYSGLARTCLYFSQRQHSHNFGTPKRWNLPASGWTDQALLFLEQGRARALLDIMQAKESARTEELQEWTDKSHRTQLLACVIHSRKRNEHDMTLEEIAERLNIAEGDFDPVEVALKEEGEACASIFRGTLFRQDTKSLYECIPPDAVVVEIDISMHGTVIMCISRRGIEHTHIGQVGVFEMRKRILNYIKSIRDMSKRDGDEEPVPQVKTSEEMMDLAAGISLDVLLPVAHIVRSRKTVIFVPSSYLQLIPLSALVLDGKPLVLQKAVYQVPSLSTLSQLAKGARHYGEALSVSVLAKPAEGDQASIPLVGAEALAICKTFGATPEDHKNLSPERVTAIFENSDIIHIATHGQAILSSAWESYLDLSKKFRVLDLARLNSRAALVVFGACWSGVGKVGGGNDLLGFSHAVLQSGALSYIGGLWAVDDRASMLLMYLFYKNVGGRMAGASLAECWQAAQATFYELDVPKAQGLLTELLDMWTATRGQSVRPRGFRTTGAALFELRETLADSGLDFKHPYFWAPFTLIGYGNLVLGLKGGHGSESTRQ